MVRHGQQLVPRHHHPVEREEHIMGQYHMLVNFDKRQYVLPHGVGDGLKIMEQADSQFGIGSALILLLAGSAGRGGRGGGDPRHDLEGAIGSWAGDRIALVGDYGEKGDLPPSVEDAFGHAGDIYGELEQSEDELGKQPWLDITHVARELIKLNCGVIFSGTGWLNKVMDPEVWGAHAEG